MATTISAAFTIRRDAEMVVETLVQEHGVDRNAVAVAAAENDNTAGEVPSGGDMQPDADAAPALAGPIIVTAVVDPDLAELVREVYQTYHGENIH